MVIDPKFGEPVSTALKRLKLYGSKHSKQGLAYRMRIDGDNVRVQRLPTGIKPKLADWTLMKAGERLLLNATPCLADITAAKKTACYLTDLQSYANNQHTGFWEARVDWQGRLVAECYVDLNGGNVRVRPDAHSPLLLPWSQ